MVIELPWICLYKTIQVSVATYGKCQNRGLDMLAEGSWSHKHLRLIVKDTKIIYQLLGKSSTGGFDSNGKTDHRRLFSCLPNSSLFIAFP